jgi:glycosyltransferase involved in cell wall biosynthesis
MKPDRELRMLFVYTSGWAQRVADVAAGNAPAEGYGYFSLRDSGFDVRAVDESVASGRGWRAVSQAVQRSYFVPRSGLGYRLHQARGVRAQLQGDPHRWIIATTDSIALPLLAQKRRGTVRNPIVYQSIGLCDGIHSGRVQAALARRYLRLAREAQVVLVYTEVEAKLFDALVPGLPVRRIPLGIDADWWSGLSDGTAVPGTILAPGRDPSRSFPTLAAAVAGLPVRTIIVGSLARAQGVSPTPTIEVQDDVPLAELRRLLAQAQLVVIPSRPSAYGSGHVTALQAMAAGKPVVMTDTGWARDEGLRHAEHFVHVPAANPHALREAISAVLDRADGGAALGRRAQALVRSRMTPARQAHALLDALSATAPSG